MAVEYFVLSQGLKKIEGVLKPISAQVIFHVDIPNADNAAEKNYRDRVVRMVDPANAGVVSAIPWLADDYAAQQAKLDSGQVFEKSDTVKFTSAELTSAQRRDEIISRANAIEAEVVARLQLELEWAGYHNTA